MPSPEAPTWYERAESTAPGHADDFFKWLDHDEFEETTGDVNSPVGWVGLLKVTGPEIATYVSTFGDPWMSEKRNFPTGWYIVRIDENGLVWGMYYGDHNYTLPEEAARADFAEAEAVYAAWDADV